ncbi:DUF5703 domain-containing protein [Paenibacillus sp. Soil787]|uniref:DUF5703 domain-containing protein n=1 Tax=Paenibacillus sp. Soil787 TaxID=1736411 RepID=UPI0006FAB753|nr:DUF5703 domain-containing protein [Paenibacillus sp. Soil787]KRF44156.1 hypothetical protein ASG93_04415 [Paenibacillus sp. Soil787]
MKHLVENYDVIWKSPSQNAAGSMPIGNGDIGLNVWVEEEGDLIFYIGKTDAWDESHRLLKLGRVRLKLSPNPFEIGMEFEQRLHLIDGEIIIYLGKHDEGVRLRIWVDAYSPVVHIEIKSKQEVNCEVELELWRNEARPMVLEDKREGRTSGGSDCSHSEQGLIAAGLNPCITADTVVPASSDRAGSLTWYHRNETSIWNGELVHQGMEAFASEANDPLMHLTTGGKIWGEDFVAVNTTSIKTRQPSTKIHLSACLLTKQAVDVSDWMSELDAKAAEASRIPIEQAREAHRQWWKSFWERSWIHVSGGDLHETEVLSSSWHLHRYTVACTARGNFPVKFNGSIFNIDGNHDVLNQFCHQGYDADFRAWGGCFWFQNQRHIYWPMLAAGDFDGMLPFFKMYLDALPFAKAHTQAWFQHDGAFFPETMYFWGGYNRTDYGQLPASERTDISLTDSGYVRRYWQGGLELLCMMLDYQAHTMNEGFLSTTLLPIATEIIRFYNEHYPRNSAGKLLIEPAQALETLWDVTNPLPEIAGLMKSLNGLLALSADHVPQTTKDMWHKLLSELPPIPVKTVEGKQYIDACEESRGESHNYENIGLYSVFPYRLFGVNKPGLDIVQNTYWMRTFEGMYKCWGTDNIFAAYLGLTDEARKNLAMRYTLHDGYRFPTFYVEGDWVPDHDNGGVAQQTLQAMLMQTDGREIVLFPAWPEEWDVEFKLHAPMNTIVEAKLKGNRLEYLKVEPSWRREDIVIWNGVKEMST